MSATVHVVPAAAELTSMEMNPSTGVALAWALENDEMTSRPAKDTWQNTMAEHTTRSGAGPGRARPSEPRPQIATEQAPEAPAAARPARAGRTRCWPVAPRR